MELKFSLEEIQLIYDAVEHRMSECKADEWLAIQHSNVKSAQQSSELFLKYKKIKETMTEYGIQ